MGISLSNDNKKVKKNVAVQLLLFDITELQKSMNMEKNFREALLRVLEDGTFKNTRALSQAAEVDQAGLSRFLKTMGYGRTDTPPSVTKGSLNLQTISKLVDCMGGVLVFPWDSTEASCRHELEKAKKLLKEQEQEIIELKAQKSALKELISDRLDQRPIAPEEPRQNKSCA